jgi:hypothetical protein
MVECEIRRSLQNPTGEHFIVPDTALGGNPVSAAA